MRVFNKLHLSAILDEHIDNCSFYEYIKEIKITAALTDDVTESRTTHCPLNT